MLRTDVVDAVQHHLTLAPAPAVAVALESVDGSLLRAVRGLADPRTGAKVDEDSVWDLASLTKTMVTVTELLDQQARGHSLDQPVTAVFPEAEEPLWRDTTLRDLMCHHAGLPASVEFYRYLHGRDAIVDAALSEPHTAVGPVYSDLGYIILGEALRRMAGRELSELAESHGFAFYPPARPCADHAVVTEDCAWREYVVRGEVHDENAAAMGGLSGHAGAFATIGQMANAAGAWLTGNGLALGAAAEASKCWSSNLAGERFGLGFFLPPTRGIGGSTPGVGSFGATGYVGNRLWVEPARGYALVVLSNRVYPRRGDRAPFDRWCTSLVDLVASHQMPSP